ncbi:MAG: hypothetical protein P8078_13010, partial [bacterium]
MKFKFPLSFIITVLGIIIIILNVGYAKEDIDSIFVSIDKNLDQLITYQKDIEHIHPLLKIFHPLALVEDNYFYIFDFDSLSEKYNYIKREPTSFPLPKRVRASFPLAGYNSKPACIVTQDIFNSPNGYVTIFHEFMHCNQFLMCESKLKQQLKIAREAEKRQDYSWELNHPFPYQDSLFVEYYSQFITALENNNDQAILKYRTKLKQYLDQIDFEYMCWAEWKEGFARLIENRIKSFLGLEENHYWIHADAMNHNGKMEVITTCKAGLAG